MAKTIFRILKTYSNDSGVSESVVYKKLVELMEQGGFTKSEVEQFISRNFMLSVEDLTKKWNATHAKQKIEMTFRGQISTLSSKYYKLFGTDADTFEEALLSGDKDNPTVVEILKILSAIGVESDPLVSRFDYTIKEYLGDYEPEGSYDFSECVEEIKLLKMIDRQNLEALFSQVDKDKLAYIFLMMRTDLIQSETTEFDKLDKHTRQVIKKDDGSVAKRKVLNPSLNKMKMELCLAFNDVKAKKLSVAKKKPESHGGVSQPIENIEESPKSEIKTADNPYDLNITKEMMDLIEKRLGVPRKQEESQDTDYSKIDSYKEYLRSLTEESSVLDLYHWLRGVNAVFLDMALDELKVVS